MENHSLPFVPTVDNFADFFTKALAGPQLFKLRDAIMNITSPATSPATSQDRDLPISRDRYILSPHISRLPSH